MATAFLNIVNSRFIHCKGFDAPLPAFCVQILAVHELCVFIVVTMFLWCLLGQVTLDEEVLFSMSFIPG